ncbi:MAG: FkbM family methyltransferase [Arenicella sp.]
MRRLIEKIAIFLFQHNLKGRGRFCDFFKLKSITFKNKFNVVMELDPNEYIDREVISKGYYEEEVVEQLIKAIESSSEPREVFWDIGANIGLHCLTLSSLYPKVVHYAFEPFYHNFSKLMINHELNSCSVTLFNFGLSDEFGVHQLYTTQKNSGRSGFIDMEAALKTSVNILSCDGDFLVSQGIALPPTMIKLDVEGWEGNVLQGCSDILQSTCLHTIIFEGARNASEIAFIEDLERMGFSVSPIKRQIQNFEENENYIAVRKA